MLLCTLLLHVVKKKKKKLLGIEIDFVDVPCCCFHKENHCKRKLEPPYCKQYRVIRKLPRYKTNASHQVASSVSFVASLKITFDQASI